MPELSCRMQGPRFTALGFGFSDLFHELQGIDRIGMSGLRMAKVVLGKLNLCALRQYDRCIVSQARDCTQEDELTVA